MLIKIFIVAAIVIFIFNLWYQLYVIKDLKNESDLLKEEEKRFKERYKIIDKALNDLANNGSRKVDRFFPLDEHENELRAN